MKMNSNVVIFGPTPDGLRAFSIIKNEVSVIAFCDNDPKLWNTNFCDRRIISPTELASLSSTVTVIVANSKYENSIIFQLMELGLTDVCLFSTKNDSGKFSAVNMNDVRRAFRAVIHEKYRKTTPAEFFSIEEHEAVYNPSSKRVFFFTVFDYAGDCGGPQGVMSRLKNANATSKLIGNDFYIFGDRVIEPSGFYNNKNRCSPDVQDIAVPVFKLWENSGSLNLSYQHLKALDDRLIWLQGYMERVAHIHERYGFNRDDIYIFHDVESCFVLTSMFDIINVALVYHNQGGLYYEYLAFGGNPGDGLYKTWLLMHKKCLQLSKKIVFPSLGGYDSLVKTTPDLSSYITNFDVIHNGCDVRFTDMSEYLANQLELFIRPGSVVFLTVAMVNDAKALERIPIFMADLKRCGIDNIQWIVVGSGPCDNKLQKAIEDNHLIEDVLWIKQRLLHSDIQALFHIGCYYIIFQKYSICDFSTIEAMGAGCIPVLSDVPGNRAYIEYNNGILIHDCTDAMPLVEFHNARNRVELSLLNVNIQREYFSGKSFLQSYKKLSLQLANQ
ncbi:glycosyltransferase [Aeromonas caviae]|uniref:glycosyltransferase n=1 Tax=Aeromonas caviae TaxID=648 RepID=UPI00191E647E|nr:glycosyltransferase [Aeromonas caviae]MBL0537431.1 glycosyltransferase [Aeromonas caviae]MDH1844613.1 glycosyltransferase [Aeromonas caviae]